MRVEADVIGLVVALCVVLMLVSLVASDVVVLSVRLSVCDLE